MLRCIWLASLLWNWCRDSEYPGFELPECVSDKNVSECPGFELPECISDWNVSEVIGFHNVHLIGTFRISRVRASGMYIWLECFRSLGVKLPECSSYWNF